MKKIFQTIVYTGVAAVMLTATGCKKDYTNPTAATSAQVLAAAKGLAGVAVGLQRTYAANVAYGMYDANGLITGETILLNAGNTSELQFSTGGTAVDGTNALLGNVWSSASKVILDSRKISIFFLTLRRNVKYLDWSSSFTNGHSISLRFSLSA